ncbi:MAG TPA: type II toxin-antitoxin system RelE/ParE family toxin [Prolixibacteraceae bacterium]|nr:type II toxin-antitoxin system RelE/ParE family toxin [Prolixibacteraceae bacterium]
MKVIWSKLAKESLAQIYDYIFEDSPQNAEMVFNTLFELGNSLSDEKVEYAKDLIINEERFRIIPKWSYKIIYERTESLVIILDIFNTYRNPKRLGRYK